MKNGKLLPDDADIEFDFDKWSRMAKTDPDEFEKMRQQLIDNLFEQAPDHIKQRLEGQQWQIDQIRRQANNPLAACIQISQKMWSSVYGEQVLLDELQEPKKLLQFKNKDDADKVVSLKEFKSAPKKGL